MEALNEGKPFLRGEKLSIRIAELASMVHEEHIKVNAVWSSALGHARNAGEWLIEAKWRTGHRSKWGRWKRRLANEYLLAERTMSQYMQIARHWENPKIQAARAEGLTIDSISKFVQVLRGILTTHHSSSKEPDVSRKKVRKEFAEYLRTLDGYEMSILSATLDDWMATANADLRERVCGRYEGPYYLHREEYHCEYETTVNERQKSSNKMTLANVRRMANADMRRQKVATRNQKAFRWNAEPTFGISSRRVRRCGKRDTKGLVRNTQENVATDHE